MTKKYTELIHKYMRREIHAMSEIEQNIDNSYTEILQTLLDLHGKVVFMGVGKSGHIGKKLAATFASTGTPAFFVHATESVHGDLGMISSNDVVILISNSGETKEILAPIRSIKIMNVHTIAFTGNSNSSLAEACDQVLLIPVESEADDMNLAPTNSSTAVLMVGDAIACALSSIRNFGPKDFAVFHPAGALGRKLLGEKAV